MSDYEGKKSIFNAGAATADRIDSLQRQINASRINPKAYNPETQTFNYEIMIKANEGLMNESWGKLTDPERIKIKKIQDITSRYLEKFAPVKNNKQGLVWNDLYLKNLLKILDFYEKTNKIHLELHDLNSPNKESYEGL